MILLTTLHDPDGALYVPTKKHLPRIQAMYDKILIDATKETHGELLELLQDYDLNITVPNGLADARRRLIDRSLATDTDYYHFCDFDRLLYWVINYPDELEQILSLIKTSDRLTILGRTPAAFYSHPWFQRRSEQIANKMFGLWYGQEIDILAASRGIPRWIAEEISKKSTAEGPGGIDAEWPVIAGDENIYYVEVNGLGYESGLFNLQRSPRDEILLRVANLVDTVEYLDGVFCEMNGQPNTSITKDIAEQYD